MFNNRLARDRARSDSLAWAAKEKRSAGKAWECLLGACVWLSAGAFNLATAVSRMTLLGMVIGLACGIAVALYFVAMSRHMADARKAAWHAGASHREWLILSEGDPDTSPDGRIEMA